MASIKTPANITDDSDCFLSSGDLLSPLCFGQMLSPLQDGGSQELKGKMPYTMFFYTRWEVMAGFY